MGETALNVLKLVALFTVVHIVGRTTHEGLVWAVNHGLNWIERKIGRRDA